MSLLQPLLSFVLRLYFSRRRPLENSTQAQIFIRIPAARLHVFTLLIPLANATTCSQSRKICGQLQDLVHEQDFEVRLGSVKFCNNFGTVQGTRPKRVQNESYCQCNSEREVWSFLSFNPIEKIFIIRDLAPSRVRFSAFHLVFPYSSLHFL